MKKLHTFIQAVAAAVTMMAIISTARAQIPIPDGFPNANTTGIKGAGLTYNDLTPAAGMNISQDGAIFDKLDIQGIVRVQANNVTIKRCRIRSGSHAGIYIVSGTGTQIEYCEIIGTDCVHGAGIGSQNYTARYCDVSGGLDGLKAGPNTTIEYCYIHDQRKCTGSHNDAIQIRNGSNITIRYNTLKGPYRQSNAIFMFDTDLGVLSDLLVEGNFMSGGGYSVYLIDRNKGYGPPVRCTFKNNIWEKDSYTLALITYDGNPTFICNRFHTGELIPENPTCEVAVTRPAVPVIQNPVYIINLPNPLTLEDLTEINRVVPLGATMNIYTLAGKNIRTIKSLSAGVYLYRLEKGSHKQFGEIILLGH